MSESVEDVAPRVYSNGITTGLRMSDAEQRWRVEVHAECGMTWATHECEAWAVEVDR